MIRSGLINLAKRIGRWLVERLARWLTIKVAHWMEIKIDDFGRRLAGAKTGRRKRWLRGRIRRWKAALAWIYRNISALTNRAVAGYRKAVAHLPMVAKQEREAA